jgi:hypothetical protein
MTTFPPSPAVLDGSGQTLSASRFLQSPNFVARRVRELSDERLIGDYLLTGRADAAGGAVGYEQVEGIFADAPPETVAPGSEYTITTIQDGPAGIARVVKQGKDTIVTDESIARRNMDPVEKGLRKLVNSAGLAVDQSVVSLVASAVTAGRPAEVPWTDNAPKVLRDILRAKAAITGKLQGYAANILLIDDEVWAYLASDTVIQAAMAREDRSNPVYSGRFDVVAGLEILPAPAGSLPGGTNANAWVLDNSQLGFIATEDLQGGYQQATELIQTKVIRLEENDGWRLRERTNFVPVVTDPGAGFRITGVA